MGQKTEWRRANELPPAIFEIWRKPNLVLSPVAIVATVDPDGSPRTAPFGSLRAMTPKLLRLVTGKFHDTYRNLSQDGRVSVFLIFPPDMSASVTGQAAVTRETMKSDDRFAVVDINVKEVKNDMAQIVVIQEPITILAQESAVEWFKSVLTEMENIPYS